MITPDPQATDPRPLSDIVRPPQRADARLNYDRLVAAASEAFAVDGVDASLDEIARRAGVGNATLYRHFPTRHALLLAVCVDDVESLCRLGDEFRGDRPPAHALTDWLGSFVEHVTSRQGLAAALSDVSGDAPAVVAACQAAIRSTGSELLADAQRASSIRPDVTFTELIKLVTAVAIAAEASDPAEAHRLITLVLEGLQQH